MHGSACSTDEETDDDAPYTRKQLPPNVATPTALVQDSDRISTSDLIYLALLQVDPFQKGGQIASSEEDEGSREIGFPGLVCRHCAKTHNGRKFFTTSSEHLGGLLLTISDHMVICKECPATVKSEITTYKTSHETQLQQLKAGEHNMCMQRVWKRLVILNKGRDSKSSLPTNKVAPRQYKMVNPNMPLVTPSDESLVTPFTFFTMQQCRPCNLDSSGNGSRSTFDFGFPGIECAHCAGRPSARRFFYRTAEILGGKMFFPHPH